MSLYLDIYHNKKRWYEFLNIYVNRKKPTDEDKEKKRLAGEIRAKREHELIVEDNGLIDKRRKMADFISFIESYIGAKTNVARHSWSNYSPNFKKYFTRCNAPSV